ncbi:lectin-like protein [Crenothrix polyspora]|uniref:C-type lectin domain-containing protein n=1 Tax=Crenothrix polyspora TaxID=360316 RepID=A0A1R4HHR6_9GAMM|nr:lectin-like protein [Crenothrix polyspora]SJM95763.1 hypothetical protein CRENPOLYSF1_770065 [Crenothrix polyspora]
MQKLHSHSVKILVSISSVLAGLLLTNFSWADSAKIRWDINGHSYQRVDVIAVKWSVADQACAEKGGYLATITGREEQKFIDTRFLTQSMDIPPRGYHIGGFKESGKWKWLNNESWAYSNWYKEHPYDIGTHLSIYNPGYWLDKDITKYIDGYICEWSNNNYLGNAIVPDINNNGALEYAVLYRDINTKHVIVIKDSSTHNKLSALTFPAGSEPSVGMIVLEKAGAQKSTLGFGVIIYDGKNTVVQLKDIHNTAIGKIPFLSSGYKPRSISVSATTISVVGVDKNGKALMEIYNNATGKRLKLIF